MLNYDFLEKGLAIVSQPHFVHDFSRKTFSCFYLLTGQISLSDCLYFLKYGLYVYCNLFPRLQRHKFQSLFFNLNFELYLSN